MCNNLNSPCIFGSTLAPVRANHQSENFNMIKYIFHQFTVVTLYLFITFSNVIHLIIRLFILIVLWKPQI